MSTATDKLSKLRQHNEALAKGDRVGVLKKTEVTDAYLENIESFAKDVIETRQGSVKDRFGRVVPAYDISLAEALCDKFGIVAPEKNAMGAYMSQREKEISVIRQFLRQNEVFFGTDTIQSAAQRFGNDNLTKASLNNLMIQHSQFDALNNTQQINADHRFLIPELIMAAIRLDYEGGNQNENWVSSTMNISQRKVTMPQIKRGNATPRRIGEAESIPFGTVRFGQKDAQVFKIGMGFQITDELVEATPLDMLFEFMGEVGTEMSIGADVEAARVLLNGEQTNLSESAPVIGVQTVGQYSYKDIRLAISRMTRLKRNVTRIITGETDGIDLSLLDEFKGFAGDTKLANLQQMLGIPATLINDIFVMPSNQIMFLAPGSAMVKLQYKSMKTEERRNPQTQVSELFVSDYVGYAIKRRDGRLVVDKSLAYGSPDNATFPSYMDVDARINNGFKTINE